MGPSVDFERLFRSLPGLYLILDTNLVIQGVTDAYLKATLTRRDAILGRGIFEVFPDNPEDGTADGTRNLGASLQRVLTTGEPDVMAVQKYDVARTGDGETGFEERYWSPVNTPVLTDGRVEWIVHRVEDVTEYVRLRLDNKSGPNSAEAEVFLRAQEVQTANERLRQMDHAKTAFLAHMSHEIRTPLNAILGLSDLALRQPISARLRDYLTKIGKAGETLLKLVDQVLDLSKIESGNLVLETTSLSLDQVIYRVRLLFEERAREQGVGLFLTLASDLPTHFLGDPLRLGQVLTNLVGNALKFTPKGEVRVEVQVVSRTKDSATLRFSVSDTGIGMTPTQQARLFQAFSQGDESMQRRYGGTGLGLRISQLIVQAMGGMIAVSSSPGAGSRFEFELALPFDLSQKSRMVVPRRLNGLRVLVATGTKAQRRLYATLLKEFPFDLAFTDLGSPTTAHLNQVLDDGPIQLVLVDSPRKIEDALGLVREIKASLPTPLVLMIAQQDSPDAQESAFNAGADAYLGGIPSASALADTLMRLFSPTDSGLLAENETPTTDRERLVGYRVLLAEDNEINRQIIEELLGLVGVEIVSVTDGQQALDRILASRPESFSLVLMDVQMPLLDGYEVTRRVKAQPGYEDLPIVALTAHALSEERTHSLIAGMVDHLTKPISPDALYQALVRYGRTPRAAVLDREDGLSRVQQNRGLYRELLGKFILYHSHALTDIQGLVNGDRPGALARLHLIRGLALNLGLGALGQSVAALETALKKPGDYLPSLVAFEQVFGQTRQEIDAYLAEVPIEEPALTVSNSPREVLKQLRDLIESRDAEAREAATQGLGTLYNVLGPRRTGELMSALSRYDFTKALEIWGADDPLAGIPGQRD